MNNTDSKQDEVWCGNPACRFCRHRNLAATPAMVASLGPSNEQASRIVRTWRATDQHDQLLIHYIRQAIDDNVSEVLKAAATPSPVGGEAEKCVKCGHSNFNRVLGHCDEPGDDDKVFCDCKCESTAALRSGEGEEK